MEGDLPDANVEEEETNSEAEDFVPVRHPIDFVLVWDGNVSEAASEKSSAKRQIFEANLESEGLILSRKTSKQLYFLKIWAPLTVLKRYGEIMKLSLPIKTIYGFTDVQAEPSTHFRQQAESCLKKVVSSLLGFGYDKRLLPEKEKKVKTLYSADKAYLFDEDDKLAEYFTPAIRSLVVQFILKRTRYKPGNDNHQNDLSFGYERLINAGVYCSGYPLHDGDYNSLNSRRGLLFREWGSLKNLLKRQPLYAIKEYFGVKIGFYFTWLGYYIWMLIPASIMGLICFIYGISSLQSDQFNIDVCNKNLAITMCPLCDKYCDYWTLDSSCLHSQFTHFFDNDSTAIFAFCMSMWTVVYLEFWKRYSAEIAHEWDLATSDDRDQVPRPEYLAKLKTVKTKRFNFVTNTVEPAVPFWRMKVPYTLFSISSMLILIVVALAAVLGVIVYRLATVVALSNHANKIPNIHGYELIVINITAACINLLFIMMFSKLYRTIASWLTELEIPRTQQDYDSSYTLKLYALQFINHYSSVFYIAYFKGNFVGFPAKYNKLFGHWRQEELELWEYACGMSCMPELCIQLAVIMVGKQAKDAILEMIVPLFIRCYRRAKVRFSIAPDHQRFPLGNHNQVTEDFLLVEWDKDALTDEYLEMVIQYGFVTIFVSAFPLAPVFALLNNLIEVRIDAQKILKYYKRPVALRAKSLGIWYDIMDGIAKFAVLSNAFIIAITSTVIPKLMYRFGLYNSDDSRYGSLNGFLQHSLCNISTVDLENPPTGKYLRVAVDFCSYQTYRYSYNITPASLKYEHITFHWKVWLARALFVIAFENVVALCMLFVKWVIPDIPRALEDEIQREEFLTNELIIQQQLTMAGVILEPRLRKVCSVEGVMKFEESNSKTDIEKGPSSKQEKDENISGAEP